jgi:hypothetical protein
VLNDSLSASSSKIGGVSGFSIPVTAVSAPVAVYCAAIDEGRVVVAYNAHHDLKIMRGELRRAGRDDLFAKTRNICAMRAFAKAFHVRRAKLADALDHSGLKSRAIASNAPPDLRPRCQAKGKWGGGTAYCGPADCARRAGAVASWFEWCGYVGGATGDEDRASSTIWGETQRGAICSLLLWRRRHRF